MTAAQYLFSFKGRVNRAKWWLLIPIFVAAWIVYYISLTLLAGVSALSTVSSLANNSGSANIGGGLLFSILFSLIYGTCAFVMWLAVSVKRLHDRDKGGLWILFFAWGPWISFILSIVFAVEVSGFLGGLSALASVGISVWAFVELACLRGTIGDNRFGPDPLLHSYAALRLISAAAPPIVTRTHTVDTPLTASSTPEFYSEKKPYDEERWSALIRYDSEIAAAAAGLKKFGQCWVDELARSYLALADRSYLGKIVQQLTQEAECAAQSGASEVNEATGGTIEEEVASLWSREHALSAVAAPIGAVLGADSRPLLTVSQQAALILAVLAILSALLSNFAARNRMAELVIPGSDIPFLPGIYFALVLCSGVYLWASKKITHLAVAFGMVVIAWTVAYRVAVQVAGSLDQIGTPPWHSGTRSIWGPSTLSLAVAGVAGGFGGSLITVFGMRMIGAAFRRVKNAILVVSTGSLLGIALATDSAMIAPNMPYLVLFLLWQPSVAALVGYEIVEQKRTAFQLQGSVISHREFALLGGGAIIVAAIGVFITQYMNEGFQFSIAQTVDTIKAYEASCWICSQRHLAEERLASLQVDAEKLDAAIYQAARGDINRLQAYLNGCSVCTFRDKADQEIDQLRTTAQLFSFRVCNSTRFASSIAVAARDNVAATTWRVRGWWSVPASSCTEIGRYARGAIYAVATVQGEPRGWYGTALQQCVKFSGSFDFDLAGNQACYAGGQVVGFYKFEADDNSFTWQLAGEPSWSDQAFADFEVCNRSGQWAAVAVSGRDLPDSNEWEVNGWWRVAPGQCEEIGRYARDTLYAVAEASDNPAVRWQGNSTKFCVEHPGPFHYSIPPSRDCLDTDLESFQQFVLTSGRYIWNLSN